MIEKPLRPRLGKVKGVCDGTDRVEQFYPVGAKLKTTSESVHWERLL